MTSIREFAPAKINLTLEVAGRRGDGFHELASLVAFADDVGDVVTLDAGEAPDVFTAGPFAGSLTGPNILDRTLALLQERVPQLGLGAIHLEKNLPVAAGIGGGSADAGALLRVVRRANGAASDGVDWLALARSLGADVSVCMEARALWMTGVGDMLAEIPGGLPRLHALLVNPMAAVPADKTVRVFRALGAAAAPADHAPPPAPQFSDREALLDFMRARGNDLSEAAERVVPDVGVVLATLQLLPGIEYAAVSGAGPTCFAIFPDSKATEEALRQVAAEHPAWWVAATQFSSTAVLATLAVR